ncbi:3-hydroxyisobutyrate dehydrogenase-like beta-hydroxyacid dehydrogenase [Hymenobacter sp. UYAg731]
MESNATTGALSVGFIGLGDQGGPMARAIGEAGFALHVWARRPASLDVLADVPHVAHASVPELAGACDLVALVLTDDKDIWDILDRQGLLKALKPGAIVVNHGTGDPSENARLAAYLSEAGNPFLDAPVSGGRPGAVARTLTTIVGGDAAALARCRPVFATFSQKIAYMGPAGAGQMAKLLNNALTMTNLKNAMDVFTLAGRLGVNEAALYEMVTASSGSSAILEALGNFTPELAAHLQGLMRKDIEHFADGVRQHHLDPTELRNRGLSGADGLVEVVNLLSTGRAKAA